MTPASKMDFRKIKSAISALSREDRKTLFTTKLGDDPAILGATLTLIESLCRVIREQEGLAEAELIEC